MNYQKHIAFLVSFFIGLVLYVPFAWIPTQMQAAQVHGLLVLLIVVALLFLSGFAVSKIQVSSGIALALGVLMAYVLAGVFTETITPWWMMATRFVLAAALVYVGHVVGRIGSAPTQTSTSSS
jgi:hypothetical protein